MVGEHVMVALRYYQKEPIKIPDEADLVIKLLKTDLRNHRLKHIVDFKNIIKEAPVRWTDYPGIYVRKVDHVAMVQNELLDVDEDSGVESIGYVWQADIQIDFVAHVKTMFYYPPHEIDGYVEENRYQHAKNCLPVLHWIVHAILAENRKYTDPDDATFQFDTVDPGPFANIDGGYDGVRDVWAIQALYRMQFEMVMRDELPSGS